MSALRLRLFVVVVFLSLIVALTAAAPRLGARAPAAVTPPPRAVSSPGTLTPNYGLRARIPQSYLGDDGAMLVDPSRDRLYISANDGVYLSEETSALHVIDTRLARPLTTVENVALYLMALTQDGARLIGYTTLPSDPGRLLIYDADTLALVDEFPPACPPAMETCFMTDMAAGPDGRLYWTAYGDTRVNVLDVATGDALESFVAADAPITSLEIAGDVLIVAAEEDDNGLRWVRRYDVGAVPAVLELTAQDMYGGSSWLIAPDGSYLIAINEFGVMQYSTGTLEFVRTLFEGGWQHRVQSLAISPDSRRVIVMELQLNENRPLFGYDAATGELEITGRVDWSHVSDPGFFSMAALADGELAFPYAQSVDIYHSADHAAAVPLVLANHCAGGPVFDDFSNINSGWPSRITDGLVYGYIDNEYAILQDDADRWFGVSRGDKWVNGRRTAVATRLTRAAGLSGLIYGLNDDWSRFYTFEIAPDLGRWVLFEFRADVGWTLLSTGIGNINPIGAWNRLEILKYADNDEIRLYINDNFVTSAPNRDGRIGLSAGSFEAGFEARYDDYAFVGQNCADYGRAAGGQNDGPPLARPPLDEFLR